MGEKNLKRSRREVHESKMSLLRELRAKSEQNDGRFYFELLESVRGAGRDVVADAIVNLRSIIPGKN